MASIGELTATVRADISGFVGPMQQVARTTQQTEQTVKRVSPGLNAMRASLSSVASAAAGIPGPVGNLAGRLLMFGAGGAVTIAVTAGLALLATAWRKWRESVVREGEMAAAAWDRILKRMRDSDKYIELVEEREAAILKLRDAEKALRDAQTPQEVTGTGGETLTLPRPSAAAIAALELARGDANRALEDVRNRIRALQQEQRNARGETAVALAEETNQLHGILGLNTQLDAILSSQLNTIQKQLAETRMQKAAVEEVAAAQRAIREAVQAKAMDNLKGDTSLKDSVREQQTEAVEAMRGVSEAMARGFVDAFRDNQKNLTAGIASALIAAAKEAMVQFLASKVFGGFLSAIFGGGKGGVPILKDIPVVGEIFSAPSAASGVGGGAISVDLSNLPKALSPIEYARDDMWRSIWVETARQAQMNGVNLQPRF